jgi:hypothetical protein
MHTHKHCFLTSWFVLLLALRLMHLSIDLHHGYPLSHVYSSPQTATQQYSPLQTISIVSYILAHPFKHHPKHNIFQVILLLAGDIELNPGPSPFSICTLNIRSLLHPLHKAAIFDLSTTAQPDIFALSETWLQPTCTPSALSDATPSGYSLHSQPRSSSHPCIGGGLAFLTRKSFPTSSGPIFTSTSFENLAITTQLSSSKFTVFNIYRPPTSSKFASSFGSFITEFDSFLSFVASLPHSFIITGDFNIHVNDISSSQSSQFLNLLSAYNLTQLVDFPTHTGNNTLDLIIIPADANFAPTVSFSPVSPSDHFPVFCSIDLPTPASTLHHVTRSFRHVHKINPSNFESDILNSDLIKNPPTTLTELVDLYNSTLTSILDSHAPLQSRQLKSHFSNPWFNSHLARLKHNKRKMERKWRSSHSEADLHNLKTITRKYHHSILHSKQSYHYNLIQSNMSNPRRLWSTINSLLHRKSTPVSPTSTPDFNLSQSFATFFSEKITKLHSSLASIMSQSNPQSDSSSPSTTLTCLQPASQDEIFKLIMASPDKQCELDPIPTFLLKKCINSLLPIITKIVNLSLATGTFPDVFKKSVITPLLKKPTLDKEQLSNYRPISNLSFLSKLTERVVKSRLDDHLSTHSLYNKFQSAYTKFHSTESTLLSLHDHLIRAISNQKLTCLCLLDLSAAFDTIDHSILLNRLQNCFGIHDIALKWFTSYLSSRSFSVLSNGIKSPSLPVTCGVPQGSVLGPLLFIIYTTPLSSLLSASSISHHLYADDTQLFISFSPQSFSSTIQSLQDTISAVANWMSANLLCLNQSKSEFMVIGLPKQLSKLDKPSLSMPDNTILLPVDSARNLGIIFDSNLSFSNQISALTKSCYYHIRDLRRIRNCLNTETAKIIATSLVHSKLDYCNSLYLNLPSSLLNRLQLIQNAAARAVTHTRKHQHITPVLKSLHWLKIHERIHYKIISLTYNALQFCQPTYIHNLLNIQQTRPTRSSDFITLERPSNPSRLKITDRSFYFHAPSLWNSLPTSLRYRSSNSQPDSVLSLSPKQFHSKLKTYLFNRSYLPT